MTAKHAVVVVGAGPTGMMLAAELALAGVEVVVLERRETLELAGRRAGGLLARTLEILDQRGIVERFVSQGTKHPGGEFAGVRLDLGRLPTRHGYVLELWQIHIERILAGWLDELGVPILRGHAVVDLCQDDSGVEVELESGEQFHASYLVGCDGGRSCVRKAAGVAFPGTDATVSNLIAVARFAREAPWGIRRDARGIHGLGKIDDGQVRMLVTERNVANRAEPTLDDLRNELTAIYGSDFGVHSPTWISRFTDASRQAASYRNGRVLLAGDAAHVHPPDGGQGIQAGMQDAMNLGWKLAQVVKGFSPDGLLDTYHAERHPAVARVLRNVNVFVALRGADDRTNALRDTFAELLQVEEARMRMAAVKSGLDVRYDFSHAVEDGSHPLVGRRMPDLDLVTSEGPARLFEFLHEARPVLLNLVDGSMDVAPSPDRVVRVKAKCQGRWELPAFGSVTPPAAVLIRPDGHVAWVGDGTQKGLGRALDTWFGRLAAA